MTTFTGRFSAGVVTFDAVCASLPPDRVARTATTTTTTKKPPVSTSASRIGLKRGRFLISHATQPESHSLVNIVTKQLASSVLAALTPLSQKPESAAYSFWVFQTTDPESQT